MADYYGTDTVVSELREDGLLIIRINRPDMANALNGATSKAMENIMNNAETDPAVRAIIVTGTGKVFCAGEDLSELSEGGECRTYPTIMTTRIAGGLLLGYNPWKAGARLKAPAFTTFRPDRH